LTDINNIPIQEVPEVADVWYLDVAQTDKEYVAIFKDNEPVLKWTWSVLVWITLNASCKRIKDLKGWSQDWVYTINPTWTSKIKVYCDMSTDWGGWTLVLKADGNKTTFNYESDYWTKTDTLNESDFKYDTTEFKSPLFNTMFFKEVYLQLVTWTEKKYITLNKEANSLREVFNSWYQPLDISKETWMKLVPWASLQPYCNQVWFNTPSWTQARIWISSNNQTYCGSNDSALWIWLDAEESYNSSVWNNCGASECSSWNKEINSFWYLYIR
jgi:hypothetical protein